mmetsp:Transcript_617/g.1708  ORF Transcript_617/g.1708 Transcript_617/m.1708 type:complete len:227 (-) Transcript_617:1234-1914(-)
MRTSTTTLKQFHRHLSPAASRPSRLSLFPTSVMSPTVGAATLFASTSFPVPTFPARACSVIALRKPVSTRTLAPRAPLRFPTRKRCRSGARASRRRCRPSAPCRLPSPWVKWPRAACPRMASSTKASRESSTTTSPTARRASQPSTLMCSSCATPSPHRTPRPSLARCAVAASSTMRARTGPRGHRFSRLSPHHSPSLGLCSSAAPVASHGVRACGTTGAISATRL